ncbi:MAG: hypothetical protein ACK5U4_10160 [Rhodospirillales bacterium]|jgi:hypothetical protein
MVAEVLAGVAALKNAFDIAKAIKGMSDAATINAAVIDLQGQILAAQADQFTLLEQKRALEEKVTKLETWNTEKQRYELKAIRDGAPVFAYALKEATAAGEPLHFICPDCYQRAVKSILNEVIRAPGMCRVQICQTCGWEAYTTGQWVPEHGKAKPTTRRS